MGHTSERALNEGHESGIIHKISALNRTMSKSDEAHLIRTCQRIRSRIEVDIDPNGGFFEYLV